MSGGETGTQSGKLGAPSGAIAAAPRSMARTLAGDLSGGIASMLVALPSAIGFGVAVYTVPGPQFAPQGAMAGMIGAAVLGLVAAIFGGTPRMISAPSGPSAAMLAGLAGILASGSARVSVDTIPVLLVLVSLFAGLLQLIYGALGGGKLIKFIPYPVVAGYLNAAGVLILTTQIPRFLGLKGNAWAGLFDPLHWNWPGVIIGSASIIALALAPRLIKGFPAPVLGLIFGVLAYFSLAAAGFAPFSVQNNPLVLGPITGGADAIFGALAARWNAAQSFDPGKLSMLVVPALTLSLLLSIDTLKTCIMVDTVTRSRHDSNRELLAQGVGNMICSIFGGLPGAGTSSATLVNLSSGAKTRRSAVFEGFAVLLAFFLLRDLIAWIPSAALAGILIVLSWRMFDWQIFRLLKSRATLLDFCVIATVVLVAMSVGLVAAAGSGLALAVLLFLREQIRSPVLRRKIDGTRISSKRRRPEHEMEVLKRCGVETLVCELQGTLFFGTTDRLFTELEADLKRTRILLLDMRRVHSVDFTAARMLEQIRARLEENRGHLVFSSVPENLPTGRNLQSYFRDLRLLSPSANVKFFNALDEGIEWAEDQLLSRERAFHRGSEATLALAEIELLRECEGSLENFAKYFSERSVTRGHSVFHEGDDGNELFIIRRGTIRIQIGLGNGRHHSLAYIERGAFFGEMTFLDGARRSADAVATTEAELFVLSRKDFEELARENPAAGLRIFGEMARTLAVRLRYTDAELRALQEM